MSEVVDGSRPPVIGISAYDDIVQRPVWGAVPATVVTRTYVTQVERAGGIALLIPARADADDAMAAFVVERIDGLVLVGGGDIDASHFGQPSHPAARRADIARDRLELALARAATAADLPLLGVCRGMQVMAVAAGGALEQHLPDRTGSHDHASVSGGYWRHTVVTAPGTRLRALLGDHTEVGCHHHQAVTAHPGYLPTAWAADDTLEGMEAPQARFRLAVQSHPEGIEDARLFAALVWAAREAAAAAEMTLPLSR